MVRNINLFPLGLNYALMENRTKFKQEVKMNTQEKAWNTRKNGSCIICRIQPARSKTAKTCCQSCAGKLAWQNRTE